VNHVDDGSEIQRNESALIFQVRFDVEGNRYNYIAVGDSKHDVLDDIVSTTLRHNRPDRLDWDLFNIPHHCSYLALGPDKGDIETVPTDNVKKLLLHGQKDAYLVSSSHPILDTKQAYAEYQPPHIQARNTYENHLKQIEGRTFLVTMEEPNAKKPEPITFEVTSGGVSRSLTNSSGSAAIVLTKPPRAG
jgi:hypothetical protein